MVVRCAGLVSTGAVAEHDLGIPDVGGSKALTGLLDDVGVHIDYGDAAVLPDQVRSP